MASSRWPALQVLREFIAARTRPQTFAQPSVPEVMIERVRYLEDRFQAADDTAAVTGQLVKLMRDFQIGGKQVHDANIVATSRPTASRPCSRTIRRTSSGSGK